MSEKNSPSYEEIVALQVSGLKNFWVHLQEKYGHDKETMRSWFRSEARNRGAGLETTSFEEWLAKRKLDASEAKIFYDEEVDAVDNYGEVDLLQFDTSEEAEQIKAEGRVQKERNNDEYGNPKNITAKRLIWMNDEQEKDDAFVLKAHGYDPEKWVVVNVLNNYWQGLQKGGYNSTTLYQSKITIKPKLEKHEITFSDINKFFSTFEFETPEPQNFPKNTKYSGKSNGKKLLINLADAHFGIRVGNYSIKKAVDILISEVIEKSRNYSFDEVLLINLGDLMHIDNYAGQTTSGTQVGERGSYYEVWEEATKSIINSIERLKVIAPVRYISVGGNHDKVSSFTSAKAVEYAFKHDNNVDFDVDFSHRKYLKIGKSSFALIHGDIPNKNIGTIIQREAKSLYGETDNAYVLIGHIHHINIVDKDGVILAHLPSIAPIDDWHESQAYTGSWKGTFCYVVDDEDGITDTWHMKSRQ